MEDVLFAVVVAARLLIPLWIPRFPLPTIVVALVVDAVDQTVLAAADAEPLNYQQFDKALDIYYLSIAYLSTFRNWPDGVAFRVAQFLWYYRLIGVLTFELSGERSLLLIFPNTFEFFFIFYEAVRVYREPAAMGRRVVIGVAAAIWIFIKLPQETFIHIAQLDATEELNARPWIYAVLAGVAVVGGVLVNRWRKTLPPPDWNRSFRVDAHPTTVLDEHADAPTGRWVLLDHPLIEKTALVGLIITIFVQLVPENDSGLIEIIVASGFIVATTSVIEYFLAGRWNAWQASSTSFACTGAITSSIVLILGLLPVQSIGDDTGLGFTLFLLALLTLIVTTYDRYRNLRIASFAEPRESAHSSIRTS